MGLALDEPQDDDTKLDEHGVTFLVDPKVRDLVRASGDVRIVYHEHEDRFSVALGRGGSCC